MSLFELTRYPRTIAPLVSQLQEASIDFEAFEQPLPLCRLHECRATCCHDGVVLSEEEASFIGEGVISLPDGRLKTETVPSSTSERAQKFPDHFPKTRCVFLDEQHRCQWQLRSVAEEKHPWFYKPISCWMHPLLVRASSDGRPLLTVLSPDADTRSFATCTPCGALGQGEQAAHVSLRGELEMLGQLSGRDFLAEINAPSW